MIQCASTLLTLISECPPKITCKWRVCGNKPSLASLNLIHFMPEFVLQFNCFTDAILSIVATVLPTNFVPFLFHDRARTVYLTENTNKIWSSNSCRIQTIDLSAIVNNRGFLRPFLTWGYAENWRPFFFLQSHQENFWDGVSRNMGRYHPRTLKHRALWILPLNSDPRIELFVPTFFRLTDGYRLWSYFSWHHTLGSYSIGSILLSAAAFGFLVSSSFLE